VSGCSKDKFRQIHTLKSKPNASNSSLYVSNNIISQFPLISSDIHINNIAISFILPNTVVRLILALTKFWRNCRKKIWGFCSNEVWSNCLV